MKKKVLATLAAMLVAGIIGFSFSQFGSVNAEPNLSPADIREKVTAQYPGTIKEVELDKKGKNPVYEIELVIDGKEYELKIDGNTGEVIRLDKKLAAQDNQQNKQQEKQTEKNAEEQNDDKDDNKDDQGEKQVVIKEKEKSPRKTNDNGEKQHKQYIAVR